MKQLIITLGVVLLSTGVFAQKEKKYIHKGNQLYQQQKYAEAEASYRQSVEKSKASVAGNFNLGDALYKQKKFDNAAQKFTEIATNSSDKAVKAQAYHNLGNSLLESKKLEESVEAYKKSLMNNPKDDQTRYNLAYAQEKLKQKQQQDKKDKNKDNKNQDKKDQDKKNQDQKGQDKKDQDKKDQDKKDQNNDQKDKDRQDQDQKDQQNGQRPQPDRLSKEDAERMLEALKNEEKNTQDKLKNKKAKGTKGRIVKDW